MSHQEFQNPLNEPSKMIKAKEYKPNSIMALMVMGSGLIFTLNFVNSIIASILALMLILYFYYVIDRNFNNLYDLIQYNNLQVDRNRRRINNMQQDNI